MTLSIYTAVKRGTLSYIMRVADTDYNQFAIVYVEKNVIFQWYFESTLYGWSSLYSLRDRAHGNTQGRDLVAPKTSKSSPV